MYIQVQPLNNFSIIEWSYCLFCWVRGVSSGCCYSSQIYFGFSCFVRIEELFDKLSIGMLWDIRWMSGNKIGSFFIGKLCFGKLHRSPLRFSFWSWSRLGLYFFILFASKYFFIYIISANFNYVS